MSIEPKRAVALADGYLSHVRQIYLSGAAVPETSYYGPLETLFNAVGDSLAPPVVAVSQLADIGAGHPDLGFFLSREGATTSDLRVPERGVCEVKGVSQDLSETAASQQVRKYLDRYSQVLLTNLWEFRLVTIDDGGAIQVAAAVSIAATQGDFESLMTSGASLDTAVAADLIAFLTKALNYEAAITSAEDLAWYLAGYARAALARIEGVDLETLSPVKSSLEGSLGIAFEGPDGDHLFRSTLVQTLFYGVFSSWVLWVRTGAGGTFEWRQAAWRLKVPMVSVLFEQLTTPSRMKPLGLDRYLDWTQDVLKRVDHGRFLKSFEDELAVQYFYEPFLEAFDPELRKEYGVWYTPREVVRYMVDNVHRTLQDEFGLELGLADENVYVLDPCTGTGSYLVETLRVIHEVLSQAHGDALVGEDLRQAVTERLVGFELMPAPYVVAHLQMGLALSDRGTELGSTDRVPIYLTNSLTGWSDDESDLTLALPELAAERDAAGGIKRDTPILVVFGNPPYNGYAGVSTGEERDLVAPYKEGLSDWGVTKNTLDDLYIRFFRVAERRIVDMTGRGIVSYISNYSFLDDPSAVVMRQRLLDGFSDIRVDSLNGDSRRTGKRTPTGLPDPSVFSTPDSQVGIQVGTAVTTMVRRDDPGTKSTATVHFRDFWGTTKRAELLESLSTRKPQYLEANPKRENWYSFRPVAHHPSYYNWPMLTDLAKLDPMLGLNENRGAALSAITRSELEERMSTYLNEDVAFYESKKVVRGLAEEWASFDPKVARERALKSGSFDPAQVRRFLFRPFDVRWAYIDPSLGFLWNRVRPALLRTMQPGNEALLARPRVTRLSDGAPFLWSSIVGDQDCVYGHAYWIPISIPDGADGTQQALFSSGPQPNLSEWATDYLASLDLEPTVSTARLLWHHVLAVGYSNKYVGDNADALGSDWARIPMPSSQDVFRQSAALGLTISGLLDEDVHDPMGTLVSEVRSVIGQLGRLGRTSEASQSEGSPDLSLRGWGMQQEMGVLPREGDRIGREWSEYPDLHDAVLQLPEGPREALLGMGLYDIRLNGSFAWQAVPSGAWETYIAGTQVLRKWLSYRDVSILRRPLDVSEARHVTDVVQRLTALAIMSNACDANYERVLESTVDL